MAEAGKKKEETGRRDRLIEIEAKKQQQWAEKRLYEYDAPKEGEEPQEKFMATFPYPYMNGRLHLGHAFSLSKPEIRTRYEIMKGKRGMFPMGFHVTGMPIAAAANRLKREIEEFGNPPVFPKAAEASAEPAAGSAPAGGGGFKGRQLKKAPANKRQWEIMESMKVPEIASFQDSLKWLEYFPPIAVDDLRRFGAAIDWRRSFITTEVNPYYDAFIQWQFRHLARQGRLAFGKRLAVFSPLEGQPCADHDRAEGEGGVPQAYTLVKLAIIDAEQWPAFAPHLDAIKGKTISLCAATLRPETMFGQTNCWILPEGEYGVYPLNDTELVIMAQRAANNMAWQHIGTQHDCEPTPTFTVTGQELIGVPLKAPLAKYERVHLLPMASVKMNKGTGIVTSVPADSPDDFVNWRQLRDKPDYRTKLGIKDEWIMPFELVSVTNIPGIGEFPAKVLCEQKNVDGPKHAALAECHDIAYLKSWEDGFLAVDDEKFRGHKVKVARDEVKAHLINTGEGIAYSEPDKKVVSRSGDECVVALCDQYYLKYGTDKEWQSQVRDYVTNGLNCYFPGVKTGFLEAVEWFGEWPCSRNFGLGTRIPVPGGERYLIDSLSDSTIYWAFYTLAPFLQGGATYGKFTSDDGSHLNLAGDKPSPAGIKPEEMTDNVWDAILLGKPSIDDLQTSIDKNILRDMRREFLYWYPIDMRGSGKDLIQNHLTMALYNHVAIFGKEMMPKSYYANGHILVDGEKMAKSKGNFLTLTEAMDAYGTDATRIAMAEAGDSLDDANFVRDVANSLVLKLTKELDWAEEWKKIKGELRTGDLKFFDRAFENAINKSIIASDKYFSNMQFREALRVGYHDLQKARDVYRQQVGGDKGMHSVLISRWVEVQALLMSPIAPHWSEYLWQDVLGNESSVTTQKFPQATKEVDSVLELSVDYLDSTLAELRKIMSKAPKKGDEKINTANVYTVTTYEAWQNQTIEWLKAEAAGSADGNVPADVAKRVPDALKKNLKEVMPFVGFLKEQIVKYGKDLTFGDSPVLPELAILTEQSDYIKQQLGLTHFNLFASNDSAAPDAAVRGRSRLQKPTAVFSHTA